MGGTRRDGEKYTDSRALRLSKINRLADLLNMKVRRKEVPHAEIRQGRSKYYGRKRDENTLNLRTLLDTQGRCRRGSQREVQKKSQSEDIVLEIISIYRRMKMNLVPRRYGKLGQRNFIHWWGQR